MKKCKQCEHEVEITDKDRKFYKMMDVPEPVLCRKCRQQRRLASRNEHNLYHRKCDLTGEDILSIYSPDKPYKVYVHNEWYGDNWDPLDYGRDFDFNRKFSEQFYELLLDVPRINVFVFGENINSEYVHDAYRLKNCYLIFDGEQAQDCCYGETFVKLQDCVDFLLLQNSEGCYECTGCMDCYNLNFSRYSYNCANSWFLLDCHGCKDCFGCSNLKQKQYCIGNEQYSKEDYEKKIKEFDLGSYKKLQKLIENSEKFFTTVPKKSMRGVMNENVTGDSVSNSKDAAECYDCNNLRDCKYCTNVLQDAKDCYDVDIWGDRLSRAYDCEGVGSGSDNVIADYYIGVNVSNVFHSYFCLQNCHDLLGCVGVKQKKHCILNKQYSKEEYEKLFPKVVEHMKKDGEWGQFMDPALSDFAYNETVAQLYFPMTKEEVLAKGWKWKEKDEKEYQPQTCEVPDRIGDVEDEICDEVLACKDCGKNYKIVPQELKFYRKKGVPVPRLCYECRHTARLKMRNPRDLWERECEKCKVELKSPYAPERPEKVYCEKCYLEEVY
jgi:hypothetical protein